MQNVGNESDHFQGLTVAVPESVQMLRISTSTTYKAAAWANCPGFEWVLERWLLLGGWRNSSLQRAVQQRAKLAAS
jgi:hypothetical protein